MSSEASRSENTEKPPSDGNAYEAAAELAQELRAIALCLIDHEVEADDVRAALKAASQVRPHLSGSRRPRWYEGPEPASFGSDTAQAFDSLSPIRGRMNPVAPPLSMEMAERADGSKYIAGRARLSNVYEGPPRGVHGGIVAALFDEILGASMALAPPPGVTAKLEVDYRHLTPIGEELRLEAWITDERDRRVYAKATCHAGDTLTAQATALFIRIDFKEAEGRMRARADDEKSL
jgi:acyl-coenzyme A thioesterase PaaI-like protein